MPHSIHRWLADLEHTACGLRRPHVVRGWQEVTCQRCLGSIHAKLAQLQRQQPASPHEPQGHPRQGSEDPGRRAAALRAARRRARSVTARVPQGTFRACSALPQSCMFMPSLSCPQRVHAPSERLLVPREGR